MRILIAGAAGQLGSDVVIELERRGQMKERGPSLEIIAADRSRLDIVNRQAVLAAVVESEPDIIINAAAWTAVDACESDPDRAFRANALGVRHLVEAASLVNAHLVHISTDYVFDGSMDRPYVEWDATSPVSVYGRSKLGGEMEVIAGNCGASIIRTAWVCGRSGANMAKTVLRLLAQDQELSFVDDQHGSPTFTADLARTLVDIAISRLPGIYHVTNKGYTTWFGFARAVAEFAGFDPSRIVAIATSDLDPPRPARRPMNSRLENAALRNCGFDLLPDWQESLGRLVIELMAS